MFVRPTVRFAENDACVSTGTLRIGAPAIQFPNLHLVETASFGRLLMVWCNAAHSETPFRGLESFESVGSLPFCLRKHVQRILLAGDGLDFIPRIRFLHWTHFGSRLPANFIQTSVVHTQGEIHSGVVVVVSFASS